MDSAKELIIAYSGPVGSGSDLVISETEKCLLAAGYKVTRIKLSDSIRALYNKLPTKTIDLSTITNKNRYKLLQDAGNELRKHFQPDVLAQLAVSKVAVQRLLENEGQDPKDIKPDRHAYLIDQLKHPAEAKLLQTVYGNLFYLIGVLCSHALRRKRMINESSLEGHEAEEIMQRDQKQNFEYGQQLDKTLELADYFIRNNHSNRETLAKQIQRFVDLIHGKNGVSPTQHETAMYVAYAAGARSACLSRQVGAAITDASGNVLATGCNDVPKAGGGLYSEADGATDMRCVNRG